MSWRVVALADVPPQAWRNGGGVTRELLAWPSAADWRVRMSVADIERDGPFSRFPGVERWFAVLDGAGVRLALGDRVRLCTPGSGGASAEPFRFSGDEDVACTMVDGATRDFNLMAPPGRSRLRRVAGSLAVAVAGAALVAVYANATPCVITGEEPASVPSGTLAWQVVEGPRHFTLTGSDALWMEVDL